jgi:hypothetical protein
MLDEFCMLSPASSVNHFLALLRLENPFTAIKMITFMLQHVLRRSLHMIISHPNDLARSSLGSRSFDSETRS